MKHNIRINGQVKEIDCELGSGILDKYEREIFEGVKVRYWASKTFDAKIIFGDGRFLMLDPRLGRTYPLIASDSPYLEIVDD